MTQADLSRAVVAAIHGAIADGDLAVPVPENVPVTRPTMGDYATPVALRLAATARRPAHEVAALLAKRLARDPGVAGVEVTGPGFLTLTSRTPGALAPAIVAAGASYGVAAVAQNGPAWPQHPLTFDNPGFLVRFAHARAVAALRHADELGVAHEGFRAELLDDPRERTLLGLLGELPGRADQAARTGDPAVLARHLEHLADAYHDVHEQCPALPRGDEPATDLHTARRWLADAVRTAVSNGLHMLGESAPDRL